MALLSSDPHFFKAFPEFSSIIYIDFYFARYIFPVSQMQNWRWINIEKVRPVSEIMKLTGQW